MKVLTFLLFAVASANAEATWNYDTNGPNGPANWYKTSPKCNDTLATSKQSPINIDSSSTKYNASLTLPSLENYDAGHQGSNLLLANNGHTVQASLKYGAQDSKAMISYKGVEYELAQFHFHWGSTSKQGSEHTMNGNAYQAEVHFVHFNKKYSNLGDAVEKEDGLLVLGNFISGDASANNTNYDPIISALPNVIYKGTNLTVPHFALKHLLPSTAGQKIFTYSGSLTTPGCFESVRWIVNNDVVKISKSQMDTFLTLKSTDESNKNNAKTLVNNYRPTQKLHKRTVETNVKPSASAANGISQTSFLVMAIVSLFYFSI